MKPMLLERKNPDLDKLKYPLYGLAKLDGIRCLITSEGAKTRSLKPVPNEFIRSELGYMSLMGLDGELIVGAPNDPDVFNKTTSGVRRKKGEPDFTYYVFDYWDNPERRYDVRQTELEYMTHNLHPRVVMLKSARLESPTATRQFEEAMLDQGYEGIILRDPAGHYKYGRTTMKEHNAFKLKRFEDHEAYVVGMIPKMHNTNVAFEDELGRIARSKKAEGLVKLKTMGALVLKDIETGIEFNCGSGFTDATRLWWYDNWTTIRDSREPVTYKKFLVGELNKPRHPIFKGLRMNDDL